MKARWPFLAALGAVILLGAYALGRSQAPTKVVTQTQWKDRIVWRDRDVEKKVVGPVRIRVVTHEIPGPRGPERIVERTVERGQVTVDKTHDAQGERTQEVKTLTLKVTEQPKWMLGATAAINPLHPGATEYGGFLNYRIGGPFWLGVIATSRGSVGASLGISF